MEQKKELLKNKINLLPDEILQVENFDLKQQIIVFNQKLLQAEIQKIQYEYDNLTRIMNSYFLSLTDKYEIDSEKYVVNLAEKCFELKK